VVEARTDAKISREAVQEIKLKLTPKDMADPDGSPLISGRKLPGER